MEKIVYDFYALAVGIEPSKEAFNKTKATASYLKDNNYSDKDIIKILREVLKGFNKEVKRNNAYNLSISGEDLPERLWENSLLKKGEFYFSDILHIKSKAPSWNPVTFTEECPPFFLEMKISFTIDDLLNYYYDKCRVSLPLQNENRDKAAMKHLIAKYDKFNKVSGIDYVIALINEAGQDIEKDVFTEIFEIENYKEQVISHFEMVNNEVELQKTNVIVWRK